MKPPELSTLSESIKYLASQTGRAWTEKLLLQVAATGFPSLQAEPRKPAPVIIKFYDSDRSHDRPVCSREIPWDMAILNSTGIEDLLTTGMTYVHDAVGHCDLIYTQLLDEHNSDGLDCEIQYRQTRQFSPKVTVSLDMVRVPAAFIENIVSGKIAWPFNIPPSDQPAIAVAEYHLKQLQQEDAILDWLTHQGYDPKALPKPQPGKSGIKSQARLALGNNPKLFMGTTFDKAWGRLREQQRIKDAPPPPPPPPN